MLVVTLLKSINKFGEVHFRFLAFWWHIPGIKSACSSHTAQRKMYEEKAQPRYRVFDVFAVFIKFSLSIRTSVETSHPGTHT